MLQRLNVPIIGHRREHERFVCPHCGEETEIFGRGGGERFAERTASSSWARSRSTSRSARAATPGVPAVAQREPGPAAAALKAIAGPVAARMSIRADTAQMPVLSVS